MHHHRAASSFRQMRYCRVLTMWQPVSSRLIALLLLLLLLLLLPLLLLPPPPLAFVIRLPRAAWRAHTSLTNEGRRVMARSFLLILPKLRVVTRNFLLILRKRVVARNFFLILRKRVMARNFRLILRKLVRKGSTIHHSRFTD